MLEKTPAILGQALSGVRAGADHVVSARPEFRGLAAFEARLRGLEAGERLPSRMTADGEGASPGLSWSGAPAGAHALAIVIEDADSPTPVPILHLSAFGPLSGPGSAGGADGEIGEGAFSRENETGPFTCGKNSFGASAFLPPDPPTGHGPHVYVVQLFALSHAPTLSRGFSKKELLEALEEVAIGRAAAQAVYGRPG